MQVGVRRQFAGLGIEIAKRRDGFVEVSEPLAVGDRVIVRGQVGLIDGAKVSVRTADGELVNEPEAARTAEAAP